MTDDDFELDTPPAPIDVVTKIESTPDLTAVVPVVSKSRVLESSAENQFDERQSIPASQEITRAKIALTFTQIFLLIVIAALILPTVVKIGFPETISDPIETTKTLITLLASVLAGPFGFIVGFYFKQGQERET